MQPSYEPWDSFDVRSTCRQLYRSLPVGALQDAVLLNRQGRISTTSTRPQGSLGRLIESGLGTHTHDDYGWCVKPTPLFHAFMATVREVCNG